jgi:hypothetical protein
MGAATGGACGIYSATRISGIMKRLPGVNRRHAMGTAVSVSPWR